MIKKMLTCSGVVLGLCAFQQVGAQTLKINGNNVVSNVSVVDFNYSDGVLTINTGDSNQRLILDTVGEPTDPGEEEPTDPGEEEPTDPGEEEPTDPGETKNCDNVEGVICSLPVPNNFIEHRTSVNVPANSVIASSFTTRSSGMEGRFNLEGEKRQALNVWISEEPGGTIPTTGVLNSMYCEIKGRVLSPVAVVNFSTMSALKCKLEAGKTYYLNVESAERERSSSTLRRTTNG